MRCESCRKAADYAREKRRRAANPERVSEQRSAYYRANAEDIKAKTKAYREAHAEYVAEWQRCYAARNADRLREYYVDYRRMNPESRAFNEQKRQAVKRGASAIPFSRDQLKLRLSMFGYKCWVCGGIAEHVDHVKPISKGGIHALSNLRPACAPCNLSKSARWPFPRASTGIVGITSEFYGLERA